MKIHELVAGTLFAFGVLFAINAHALEEVNPDFEHLKNRLIGN